MNLDPGLLILLSSALALIVGLGAWIWEFLSARKSPSPSGDEDVLGAAIPRPQSPKPILPRKDIKPTPVPSLSTKAQVELPPKAPNVPAIQIDQKKTPSWTTTFPSLSTHKKEYDQKISEPSSALPKAVKNQSPLPEFGGMCNNCGEKPKVPGNDGFCAGCSELC